MGRAITGEQVVCITMMCSIEEIGIVEPAHKLSMWRVDI